jgi:4,4'-diaponeurosporenoate glycosyltransferase
MLILLYLAVLLWAAGLLLLPRLRPLRGGEETPADASLSIIIPARDEEHNLPALLQSITSQGGAPCEIIVVDDGSTDRTAGVAREGGATVIASQPLPEGWRGKTWACHQGATAATGDLFCFLDADTTLEPEGLARLRACYPGGAFSVVPWHRVGMAYENLSLFFNLNMVAGTAPDGLFGQMLLVDRMSYLRAGGHEAVRGNILENFRLAAHFREHDIPVRSAAGKGVLTFRMYPEGLQSLIEGWTKGFAAGAGGTPRGVLLLLIGWMSGLMIAWIGMMASGWQWTWVLMYLAAAGQVAWLGRRVGGFHPLAALLYPVPLVFFFGLFARSAMRSGKSVKWKGRDILGD